MRESRHSDHSDHERTTLRLTPVKERPVAPLGVWGVLRPVFRSLLKTLTEGVDIYLGLTLNAHFTNHTCAR